ncbi:hypothetical protein [Rickettsia honei]|uniref:hypothetical protein n=1 Tax=Rickettsia honei TaxID=37816 RepID=UPI00037AA7B9|nr:hypothetical protein [Rickettsia honei]
MDGGVTNNYLVEVFDDKTAVRSLPQTDNKNYKTLGFKPINKEILEAYQNGTEPKNRLWILLLLWINYMH